MLSDRLAHFLYETAQRMPASYDEADIGFWEVIADALLASEEWQAREVVVEAAQLRATLGDLQAHHALTCPECGRLEAEDGRWCDEATGLGRQGLDADKACRAALAALARLDAGKEEGRDRAD